MKKTGIAACILAACSMVLACAATTPASALTGTACTQRGTPGNDNLSVNVGSGQTVVVCTYTGADTVTINSGPIAPYNAFRLIIVKGKAGSLNVRWNAGGRRMNNAYLHNDGTFDEFVIIRPPGVPVTRVIVGDWYDFYNANKEVFSNAWCATNAQYTAASTLLNLYNGAAMRIRGQQSGDWAGTVC